MIPAFAAVPLPIAGNPPTANDVCSLALHRQRAIKRKLADPAGIPDDNIVHAMIAEHIVSVLC